MKKALLIGLVGLMLLATTGCDVVVGVGCESGGNSYATGETFLDQDGCNHCSCEIDGSVVCTDMACNPIDECVWGDQTYAVGETFGDDCNTCECMAGGDVMCTMMPCEEVMCEYDGTYYRVGETIDMDMDCTGSPCVCGAGGYIECPDGCFDGCEYFGLYYPVGSSFPEIDSCNTCYCLEGGGVSCTEIGCPLPAPGFEENLTTAGGCGDMFVYATNADDSIALNLQLEDVVSHAFEQKADVTYEFGLPSSEVDLSVTVGRLLSANYCNDVFMYEPQVAKTYHPISGNVTVLITRTGEEQPWELPAHADVLLENVVFQDDDGAYTVTVDNFEMNNVFVGWFPG